MEIVWHMKNHAATLLEQEGRLRFRSIKGEDRQVIRAVGFNRERTEHERCSALRPSGDAHCNIQIVGLPGSKIVEALGNGSVDFELDKGYREVGEPFLRVRLRIFGPIRPLVPYCTAVSK